MQELSQLPTTPPYSGADLVADTNKIARTLGTDFAGPDDPAAIAWPYSKWADTANNLQKRRNAANTAWEVESELFQRSARRNGDGTQNFDAASLNGGPLAGMRNRIINGAFQINQRGYVSGAATTAGQYTLDRWKVTGTSGITFSTSNGKTTVTIPAGQTLKQVIEGINLPAGDYVLSWEGTAQGRVDGGAYGASGTVKVTLTGGVNSTVEFNSGTLANVQLEPGSIATAFEWRIDSFEFDLCAPYYEIVAVHAFGYELAGQSVGNYAKFKRKRATPALSFGTLIHSTNATSLSIAYIRLESCAVFANAIANGATYFGATVIADSEI